MNKYFYKIIILLLVNLQVVNSQDFKPVQFEGFTPRWMHYSKVDSLSIYVQGYITEGKPLFVDDHIYILSNIFNIAPNQGPLLEKIDHRNGQLLWSKFTYSETFNEREFATNLKVEDNQVKMIIHKERDSNPLFGLSLWFNSYLGRRSFSDKSGAIIEDYLSDITDTLNKTVQMPLNLGPGVGKTYADNEIIKFCTFSPVSVVQYKINEQGHHLDTLRRRIAGNNLIAAKSIYVGDLEGDKVLILAHSFNQDLSTEVPQVKFYVMDHDLNILHEHDITLLLPRNQADYILLGYNESSFHVTTHTSPFNFSQLVTVSSFDYNGNLLERFSFEDINRSEIQSEVVGSDNTMLIAHSYETNGVSNIKLYKSDGKGNLSFKQHLKPVNENDQLYLYRMYYTPNDDVLLSIYHIDKNIQHLQFPPNWKCLVLMDGQDLGIKTSTNEERITNKLTLYPNPTTNTVTIANLDAPAKVDVYNLNGALVSTYDNVTLEVHIGQLPPGMYIFDISNRYISEKYKVIKF